MAMAYERPEPQEDEGRRDKLMLMLKAEEEQALTYAENEIIEQQIEALQRYYGEKYGDEEEGRSQVTTREVLETIEWTRPDLMRVFASGGNVVYLEETSKEDASFAQDAADYLQWIFFSDNPGFELLDDFAFDGLLHRRGYLACYWRDKEYAAPQKLTGLNIMQVAELQQDPKVEILGQDFDGEGSTGITLIVRKVKYPGRVEIVSIAPEDMRLSGRTVTIDGARYVGRVNRMLAGEAARLWPEMADEILEYGGADRGNNSFTRAAEDVRQERFRDDSNTWRGSGYGDGNGSAQEVEILEEYIRVDLNDDGYPETIRAYRLGDLLLEESEVEENPFGTWTPVRVPHRFMGLSMHDLVADLQRRSTVLTRAALDAVYQSVVNREFYDRNKLGEDSVAALLSTVAGTKIPVDGDPNGVIMPATGGIDTAQVAWDALNQLAATLENRTGATRQTQGLDPDALLKGPHSGRAIEMLQTAGGARKEMVARNMASGLGQFFSKLYRLVCRNQDEEKQAKVGGKWCEFDPRTWNSDLRVTVHTGLGTGNRDQTIAGLIMIRDEQNQVIEALGPDNPNVTIKNRYAVQEELTRALGYRSGDRFFTEPEDVPETDEQGQPAVDPETGEPKMRPWAPPPQQDPAMAKVEADTQYKQAQMQVDMQMAQAKQQLEVEKTQAQLENDNQKTSAQLEQDRQKAELDIMLAREKAAAELELAREKATAERQLAYDKMEMEYQLALKKMEIETELERERIASQERIGKAKASMSGEDDKQLSSNRPGGALDE